MPVALANVKRLTSDNAAQQALCVWLESNANHRVALSQESVRLQQQHQNDAMKQQQMTFETARAAIETSTILEQMRANEDLLLARRAQLSEILFRTIAAILTVSFLLSAIMFWIHYRLVGRELEERKAAGESRLRELSVRLMKVQDEESRRFARKLHDGLGQGLVAAKMVADSLAMQNPSSEGLTELMALLDDSVSATRTLSYLLHPPMLDEMGFASAANWFIEGYSRRTGISVSADVSPEAENLPSYLACRFFAFCRSRLRTCIAIRRAKADGARFVGPREVLLMVKDYGRRIQVKNMTGSIKTSASVGVGLAGMKEKVAEMKGKLVVKSDESGTCISVAVPLIAEPELSESTGATA